MRALAALLALATAGCATVPDLIAAGDVRGAWRLGCEQAPERESAGDRRIMLPRENGEAVRDALRTHTRVLLEGRAWGPKELATVSKTAAFDDDHVLIHLRMKVLTYPGDGVTVAPRMRIGGKLWREASGEPLPVVTPSVESKADPHRRNVVRMLAALSKEPCHAAIDLPCERVSLVTNAVHNQEPEGTLLTTMPEKGPDALIVPLAHQVADGSTCIAVDELELPLPPGEDIAARVNALFSRGPVALGAGRPFVAPIPSDLDLDRCEGASPWRKQEDAALQRECIKRTFGPRAPQLTVAVGEGVDPTRLSPDAYLPLDVSVASQGEGRVKAFVSLVHDGVRWTDAKKHAHAARLARALFRRAKSESVLPRIVLPRTPFKGLLGKGFQSECWGHSAPSCEAKLVLMPAGPAFGPDALDVDVTLGFDRGKEATRTVSIPLAAGSTLKERIAATFAKGPILLAP